MLLAGISHLSPTGTTDRDYVTLDGALICGERSVAQLIDKKSAHAYSQVDAVLRGVRLACGLSGASCLVKLPLIPADGQSTHAFDDGTRYWVEASQN